MNTQKTKIHFSDLHGERIDLIKINEGGLKDMHEYSIKPEFYKYFEFKPFITIQETKNYLQKLIKFSKSGIRHIWFIKFKQENKIIGTFDVRNIDFTRLSAEIGYGISPDYWGKGFFKEALMLVLKYLFVELGFYRITAISYQNNLSSIKGLERVGFKTEGTLRKFFCSRDNKRSDGVLLSILRDEFLQD